MTAPHSAGDRQWRAARPVRRKPGRLNRVRLAALYGSVGLVALHMYAWYVLDWRAIGKLSFSGFVSLAVGHLNMAAVFCAVLLVSLALYGRLFCGWLCKLSAFQEATEWLYQRIGFRPALIHTRAQTVRLFTWVPYLLPLLYTWQEVGLSTAYVDLGRVEPWTPDLPKTVLFSAFYFASITFGLTAMFGRRAFCRLVCPFALFFQLFEALPWVPRIRQSRKCIECGVCDTACPMGLPVQNQILHDARVTDPECVRCMICVDVCPVKALSFGTGTLIAPQDPARPVPQRVSALPVAVDVLLATLAVGCGVWAATRITGFHVFLGASWGLIAGLLLWRLAQRLTRLGAPS